MINIFTGKTSLSSLLIAQTAMVMVMAVTTDALAVPKVSSVSAGSATVNTTSYTSTGTDHGTYYTVSVNQTSPKAVINWSNFDLLATQKDWDTVLFNSPKNGITLNIISGPASQFTGGSVSASGGAQWFINPNGFKITSPLGYVTSVANSGNLLFSTANVSNPNGSGFYTNNTGNYNFDVAGNPSAQIQMTSTVPQTSLFQAGVNNGASSNLILQAPGIYVDSSVLQSSYTGGKTGEIALGAGQTFEADFSGNTLSNYGVTTPDAAGSQFGILSVTNSNLITNGGGILADAYATSTGPKGSHLVNWGGTYYDTAGLRLLQSAKQSGSNSVDGAVVIDVATGQIGNTKIVTPLPGGGAPVSPEASAMLDNVINLNALN